MKEQNPFKEKLYQHTLPVSDELWSRIELQLPVQRERRKFPFFFLALVTVLLTAAIILFLSTRPEKQMEDKVLPPHKSTTSP